MIDPAVTCCFTGHRPEKLHESKENVIKLLEREINRSIVLGYNTFISGMATGVDLWAADIVLSLGQRLIAALPYEGYAARGAGFGPLYRRLMEGTDEIITCSVKYSPSSYLKRDRWMVDNSSLIIAVYHGESGGTENTVKYAQENGKKIFFCR